MIYTLGCSFTKWFWPTWADWLAQYSNQSVCNLAWPGMSNQTIYWELIKRSHKIHKDDHVYVMFTGNNRTSVWYDEEWINKHDCKGFFPRQDGLLECSDIEWQGLYRNLHEHEPSYTHMVIENFNLILQVQNLLSQIGCKFTFMLWQNPWCDIRPITTPVWQSTWQNIKGLTNANLERANTIREMDVTRNLIGKINWNNFVGIDKLNIEDPNTYTGLWEYNIDNLKKNIDFVHNSDHHPNTYTQHEFVAKNLLLPKAWPKHRQTAKDLALELKNCNVEYEYEFLIPDNIEENIYDLRL